MRRGTWCATYDNEVVLYWDQQRLKRTIPLDPEDNNIASIRTAPGFTRFNAFCARIGDDESPEVFLTYDTGVVSDDEGDQDDDLHDDDSVDLQSQREHPMYTDFDLDGPKGARTVGRVSPVASSTQPHLATQNTGNGQARPTSKKTG